MPDQKIKNTQKKTPYTRGSRLEKKRRPQRNETLGKKFAKIDKSVKKSAKGRETQEPIVAGGDAARGGPIH